MSGVPGYLNEGNIDIPMMTRPVYWDSGHPINTNVHTLDRHIEAYSRYLPVGAVIDEASVLVPGPWHAGQFIDNLVAAGWEHFNGADDLVYANPFSTRYFVRYEFLRSPARSYRLEVMYINEGRIDGDTGFSPLHQALWTPNGRTPDTIGASVYPVPHLSFKAPHQAFTKHKRGDYSRAVAHLQSQGLIHAQTCQSTYGVFGYYIPNDAVRQVYLKPRVNLRDQEPAKPSADIGSLMAAGAHGTVTPDGSDVRAVCGQAYPCEHALEGGNHPVVGNG